MHYQHEREDEIKGLLLALLKVEGEGVVMKGKVLGMKSWQGLGR